MKKLPVLISIPHGGTRIPEEIRDRVTLSQNDMFKDGDAFTREIYGIGDEVSACVEADIARVFVDLNRDIDDRPPGNPDGIIKTQTCHGKQIYNSGRELDEMLIEILLDKYYEPYHRSIRNHLESNKEIQLFLDCHSMESVGPAISPDPGQERPTFCLGTNRGKSCPPKLAERMAECFQRAFGLQGGEVTTDRPFAGGFITRTYGDRSIPCLQIEMNRNLYLSEPWFDQKALTVKPARLNKLRESFRKTLRLFFKSN